MIRIIRIFFAPHCRISPKRCKTVSFEVLLSTNVQITTLLSFAVHVYVLLCCLTLHEPARNTCDDRFIFLLRKCRFQLLSDEESEFSPFERHYRPAQIPNLDISDDESSGISSTDVSLENYIHGELPALWVG